MAEREYFENFYYNYNQLPWRSSAEMIYSFHLDNILQKLSEILGDYYYNFTFVIYDHNMYQPLPEFKITGSNVILIFLSDEKSTVPLEICDKFFAIFKTYYPLDENTRNIIAFPIGYSNSANLTSFQPFEERRYDASFAGNFLSNRLDFYRQFTWLKYLPPFPIISPLVRKTYFKILTKLKIFRPREFTGNFGNSRCYWSGGFAKGLPREEYAAIISDTRIALCPKGFMSTECYRLMETMRLGCVIISDELPPSRWYKDSPIIVQKDWLNIDKVITGLTRDPQRMLDLHRQTLAWWRDVCSDEAVANYLADEIKRIAEIPTSKIE
ncbi:MAG: hypothetical protein ABI600_00440 [Luteolibacter sp.]